MRSGEIQVNVPMSSRLRIVLIGFATMGGLVTPSAAESQWSLFSDEEQLRSKVIVDVGEISEESRLVDRYDPLLEMETMETVEWWEFEGEDRYCMEPGYSSLPLNEAALLLVDEDRNVFVAVIESSIGSIKVSVEPILVIDCPSPYYNS